MNVTITPVVTPQQQMALAFRDFPLPEGTEVEVEVRGAKQRRVKVWTIKSETSWVEAFGRDPNEAVANLVREVARP